MAIPSLDMVVVVTGSNHGFRHIARQKQVFHMLYKYIPPAVRSLAYSHVRYPDEQTSNDCMNPQMNHDTCDTSRLSCGLGRYRDSG